MGIPAPLAELIAFEHAYRPIGRRIVSLGRQTVLFDETKMKRILQRQNLPLPNLDIHYDNVTVQARMSPDKRYITDETFWRALDVERLDVLDISGYEQATIIHDMCRPIPEDLEGRYSFIFNGSILDNLFDPATAMRNITRMLTPGGRVCHIEMASNLAFEYLIYSPDWFWDYYAYNHFDDCKVYLCCFDNLEQLLNGPWRVHFFSPKSAGESVPVPSLGYRQAVLVVFAEKGHGSTWSNNPVQWCYRSDDDKAMVMEARKRFNVSLRPVYFSSVMGPQVLDVEGFHDCGSTITTEIIEKGIIIVEASYGLNCAQNDVVENIKGNITDILHRKYSGQEKITFKVDVNELGDPSPGLEKDLSITWRYAEDPKMTQYNLCIAAEANGKVVEIPEIDRVEKTMLDQEVR